MFMCAKNLKKFLFYSIAFASVITCIFCIGIRILELSQRNMGLFELLSMGLIMSDGKINEHEEKINVKDCNLSEIIDLKLKKPEKKIDKNENTATKVSLPNTSDDITNFTIPHNEGENTFKIIESHFGDTGIKYDNFYVNNKSGIDINIADELNKKPDINIKKDGTPQVLIYHTHTCEAYMDKDQGFYYESFYPRTENKLYSVVRVGDAICESLKKAGIGSIHDTTCHDSPSFNGSYKRSSQTIDKNLSEHPSIQVTIDIHRDTIGNNERGKIKPTFKVGDKKAAQIMIMTGCDADGTLGFPDWEYNLRLALRLQKNAETLYPGMTRALFFGPVKYNMSKTHASLLIEVGTDVNTLGEAVYTGSMIGDALVKVFEGL